MFWRKLALTLFVPLVGVLVWYYPLVESAVKPSLVRSGIARAVTTPHVPANNTFSYPALGISSPIVVLPQSSPLKTNDWQSFRAALRQGIGVSYDTDSFDSARLVFATGHSSDTYPHSYASIFASLNQAKPGDEVTLVVDNNKHTYRVVDSKVINPGDTAAFKALEPINGEPNRLVLVTCWPVLTTANRRVVIAEQK